MIPMFAVEDRETEEFGLLFTATCECGAACAHTSHQQRADWVETHAAFHGEPQ